jgi:hypothetical protein
MMMDAKSADYERITAAVRKHGIEALEVNEIGGDLFIIKGYFFGDRVGLYLYDAAADRAARFTWHGVNIGDYAFSARAGTLIAVCVHPPKTQKNDERATVMGYDIGRIHADILRLSRERVERTTDAGSYGFIVVRPGYLFRSLEYKSDGIYFTAEAANGERDTYFLRSPGEAPKKQR